MKTVKGGGLFLKKGAKKLLFSLSTIIFIGIVFVFILSKQNPGVKSIGVTVSGSYFTPSVFATGVVKEKKWSGFYYNIPVKIKHLYVKVGDCASKGDVLAEIDIDATSLAAQALAAGLIEYNAPEGESAAQAAKLLAVSTMTSAQINRQLSEIPQYITAAYDCKISDISVSEGQFSTPVLPVITMTDMTEKHIEVLLNSDDADTVYCGQQAVFTTLDGESLGAGNVADVSIRATASQSDSIESKTCVIISFTDSQNRLSPNERIDVSITSGQSFSCVIIPYESIFCDTKGEHVFVLYDGKAVRRSVAFFGACENGMAVKTGIDIGETVIIPCSGEINDGTEIIIIESRA